MHYSTYCKQIAAAGIYQALFLKVQVWIIHVIQYRDYIPQSRKGHLFRNILQQMYLLGCKTKVAFSRVALILSEIPHKYNLCSTFQKPLISCRKTFKGTFRQEIQKLWWSWEHKNECIHKYQIGKETIKSLYNFASKILVKSLDFSIEINCHCGFNYLKWWLVSACIT